MRPVSYGRIPIEFMYKMGEYLKILHLGSVWRTEDNSCSCCDIFGIVVEILSIPAKDWNKSPVPLPAEIAQSIIKKILKTLKKQHKIKIIQLVIIQKDKRAISAVVGKRKINKKQEIILGFQAASRPETILVFGFGFWLTR